LTTIGSAELIEGLYHVVMLYKILNVSVVPCNSIVIDDTRSYIVFSTMFMSFELSSGDFI